MDELTCDQMISFVIPVYRSAESLPELHRRIVAVFCGYDGGFEIVFVEDCGGDQSWDVIGQLAESDPRVRAFRMSRNFGQHNALLCGICRARGEIIVTLDDDLQHPPELVPVLLERLQEGFDVVYGAPVQERHGKLRDFASRVTKLALESAMGADNARSVSSFRVFKSSLGKQFSNYCSPTVNIDVLLSWVTTRFGVVKISHTERKFGASGYTFRKLIKHAVNLITGYSTRPLQLASIVGFAFALFGFLIFTYVVFEWLTTGAIVPGFAFLASIIAIFSGAQMMALGVIGEYLARMYYRTLERPVYAVAEEIDNSDS